jgi:hypothetical protein
MTTDQALNVFDGARRKFIHRPNLIASSKQMLGKMRTYKSCTTRNQSTHIHTSVITTLAAGTGFVTWKIAPAGSN